MSKPSLACALGPGGPAAVHARPQGRHRLCAGRLCVVLCAARGRARAHAERALQVPPGALHFLHMQAHSPVPRWLACMMICGNRVADTMTFNNMMSQGPSKHSTPGSCEMPAESPPCVA